MGIATKVMLSSRTQVNFVKLCLRGALSGYSRVLGMNSTSHRLYSTKEEEPDSDDEYEFQDFRSDEEENFIDVEKLQDVSRLKKHLRARMDHVLDADYHM